MNKLKAWIVYAGKYVAYLVTFVYWALKKFVRKQPMLASGIGIIILLLITAALWGRSVLRVLEAPKPLPLTAALPSSGFQYIAMDNKTQFSAYIGQTTTNVPKIQAAFANGNTVSFVLTDLNGNLSKPTKTNNELLFTDVRTNVDLSYQTLINGIKENIIIKQPTSGNAFTFDLNTKRADPKRIAPQTYGSVFYDTDGTYLFNFVKPFAVDAKGVRTDNVVLAIHKKDTDTAYQATIIINQKWLSDPARVYPITVDPTIVYSTSSLFSSGYSGITSGTYNRVTDTGSGASPNLTTYYQELSADQHTVGLWHMNESSGSSVSDSSGNSNTGTATGTTVVSGVMGNGRSFNGTSDVITVPNSSTLSFTNNTMTAEAWIKVSGGNPSVMKYVILKGITTWEYAIAINTTGTVYSVLWASGGAAVASVTSNRTVTDGNWHHIAFTSNGSIMSVYIDGTLDNSTTTFSGSMSTTAASLYFGDRSDTGSTFFSGSMDEIRLSNVARSAEEIRLDAQRRPYSVYTSDVIDLASATSWNSLSWSELGVGTGDGETLSNSSNLVAQWNFNETSGTSTSNALSPCTPRWVAGGTGANALAYSADGITWTGVTGTSIFGAYGDGATAVAWNGTKWVAIGADNNNIAYSSDGITWTGLGYGPFNSYGGYAVAWNGTKWLAGGQGSSSIAYSADGITWTGLGTGIFGNYANGFAWNGTKWVALGGASPNTIAYSSDGITWTGLGKSIFSTIGDAVAWNGTRWVAAGQGTNSLAYSADGITWTGLGTGIFSSYGTGVAWNGTRWVTTGVGTNSLAYSADGITWTGLGLGPYTYANAVAWNGTRWVTVGSGSSIAYSSDGITWTGLGKSAFSSYGRGVASVPAPNLYPAQSCGATLTGFSNTSGQDVAAGSGWTTTNARWPKASPAALMFLGSSSNYVNLGTDSTLDVTTPMSIEAWIKTSAASGSYGTIISNYAASKGYILAVNGTLAFWDGSDSTWKTSSRSVNDGAWHYVVVTHTSGSTSFYIDGNLDSTVSQGDPNANAGGTKYIGQYNSANYFTGVIDSTRVYSRALSASEILSNYNAGNTELQTRVGTSTDPNDGTWEAWKPTTSESQILSLDADSANWSWDNSATYMPNSKSDDSTIKVEGTGSMKLTTGIPQSDANTVGLWHLDETGGSGAYIKDASPNANNGTPTGTTVVNGIAGKARSFNGSSYITTSNLNTGVNMTAEAWIKPTSVSSGQGILGERSGTTNSWAFYILATGKLDFTLNGTADYTSTATTLAPGVWQHVAVTTAGTALTIYLNGSVFYSTTMAASLTNGAATFGIGADSGAGSNPFTGSIDEVRVSNIARTSEAIAEDYRMGTNHYLNRTISSTDLSGQQKLEFNIAADRPGTYISATIGNSAFVNYQPDGNTVGLWHLDEQNGSGAFIRDSAGSNNGSLVGTTSVQGKIGRARSFNGTSDYISVPDNSTLDPASQITTDAWIKTTGTGTNLPILGKSTGCATSGYLLWLNENGVGAGKPSIYIAGGTVGWLDGTSTVNDGNWHYIAGTYDGTTAKIYIDGILSNSKTGTGTLTSTTQLQIGGSTTGAGCTGIWFPGTIDEVRISNTARSAADIRAAYESGLRTHQVTIDFAANLNSGGLISSSSTLSFIVDATKYGFTNMGSNLYPGDKIIVRENYNGTTYIAQGTVANVTASSGAVTVESWDTGSTFPTGGQTGFSANADVFKWQKEYMDLSGSINSQKNAITTLSLRETNGNEGRTIWLDDIRSAGSYLTTPGGSSITSSTGDEYFQYRIIDSSDDYNVSSSVTSATLDYVTNRPLTPVISAATVLSSSSIQWNFTAGSGSNAGATTGYKVYDTNNTLMATCVGSGITSCAETGLSPNTQYTRKVAAYNANGNSVYSATTAAYTLAAVPSAPITSSPTSTTLLVTPSAGTNPSGTQLAIYLQTGTVCNGSGGYYLAANGTSNGSTALWQTAAAWGTVPASGLNLDSNQYAICVKAINANSVQTAFSPTESSDGGYLPRNANYTVTENMTYQNKYIDGNNPGMTVAAGYGNNNLGYSFDGITWTGVTGSSIFSDYGEAVAWNGTRWVAGGGYHSNGLAYSNDGITWTGLGAGVFSQGMGVAWNGTRWVAGGSGTNTLAYSSDGITWTGVTGTSIFSSYGQGVAWNGTRWVAAGSGSSNTLAYSADGITWTGLGTGIFSSSGHGVAWNGTRWVAVGDGSNTLAYSADGITWTGLGAGILNNSGHGVAWNGTRWVAGGWGSTNSLAYSNDGITWTGLGAGINNNFTSVAWNGTRWVAGAQGSMAYSSDGITWTGLGAGNIFSQSVIGLAAKPPRYIAGLDSGTGTTNNSTLTIQSGVLTVMPGDSFVAGSFVFPSTSTGSIALPSDGTGQLVPSAPIWMVDQDGDGYPASLWAYYGAAPAHGNRLDAMVNTSTVDCNDSGTNASHVNVTTNANCYIDSDADGLGTGTAYTCADNAICASATWASNGNGTTAVSSGHFAANNTDCDDTNAAITVGTKNRWVAVGGFSPDDTIAYSNDGITWTGLGYSIFTRGDAVAWNGTRFVAVGEASNSIAYSNDGITWTGLGASLFNGGSGYGVAWNGSKWMAGGNGDNALGYSTDGITWTGLGGSIFATNRGAMSIAWNGSKWMAGGLDSDNSLGYSTDGITWTGLGASIFPNYGFVSGIAWNGTRWVAVGEGDVNSLAYSSDGITWTGLGKSVFGLVGYGVASNGIKFVGVNAGIYYSSDGITWAGAGSPFGNIGMGAAWNGTRWVAVGGWTPNTIAYSADGITWTGVGGTLFGGTGNYGLGVASAPAPNLTPSITNAVCATSRWVAAGSYSVTNTLAYSADGIAWTGLGATTFSGGASTVAWNGTRWVGGGSSTNTLAYSADGITWTGLGASIITTHTNGVAWNGTRWVAAGVGTNTLAYSADGIAWTGKGASIFSTQGSNVAWNGTRWVAAGVGTNTLAYSADGITWTGLGTSIFGSSGGGESVAWNGTRWVVGGYGTSTLGYSSDGIIWTGLGTSIFGSSGYGYGVAWNGTRWVADGYSTTNTLGYSADGITWTGLGKSIFDTVGFSVAWNGTRFAAVGHGTNTLAYSTDGITWTGVTGTSIFGTQGQGVASAPAPNLYPAEPGN